jgi:hypothetical protein
MESHSLDTRAVSIEAMIEPIRSLHKRFLGAPDRCQPSEGSRAADPHRGRRAIWLACCSQGDRLYLSEIAGRLQVPSLEYERPVDLIRAGRAREVLNLIDALGEGVFA